jgi:hypothetical protein
MSSRYSFEIETIEMIATLGKIQCPARILRIIKRAFYSFNVFWSSVAFYAVIVNIDDCFIFFAGSSTMAVSVSCAASSGLLDRMRYRNKRPNSIRHPQAFQYSEEAPMRKGDKQSDSFSHFSLRPPKWPHCFHEKR